MREKTKDCSPPPPKKRKKEDSLQKRENVPQVSFAARKESSTWKGLEGGLSKNEYEEKGEKGPGFGTR